MNPLKTTEGYDGTNWATRPSLGAVIQEHSGTGTGTLALKFGGNPTSAVTDLRLN